MITVCWFDLRVSLHANQSQHQSLFLSRESSNLIGPRMSGCVLPQSHIGKRGLMVGMVIWEETLPHSDVNPPFMFSVKNLLWSFSQIDFQHNFHFYLQSPLSLLCPSLTFLLSCPILSLLKCKKEKKTEKMDPTTSLSLCLPLSASFSLLQLTPFGYLYRTICIKAKRLPLLQSPNY